MAAISRRARAVALLVLLLARQGAAQLSKAVADDSNIENSVAGQKFRQREATADIRIATGVQ